MKQIILRNGIISGLIIAAAMLLPISVGVHSVVIGYLAMLVALAMVFVGVKRYRDEHLGGTIRFWPAFGVGLAIAGIATVFYVVAWEAYLYSTGYTFMSDYTEATIEAKRAEGMGAAELAALRAEFDGYVESYKNPLYRVGMTATEIAPVALLVSLVAATLIRRPGFMPARTGAYDKGE